MINAITTALSGLLAASKRVDASANNIANAYSAGTLEPEKSSDAPYSAQEIVQKSVQGGGVSADIVSKNPGFVPAYDPGSPLANEDGLVGAPNVDISQEAVNLKLAETAYKASLSVIKAADEMNEALLNSFDERV